MAQSTSNHSSTFVNAGEQAFENVGKTLGDIASQFSFAEKALKFAVGAAVTAATKPDEFQQCASEIVSNVGRAVTEKLDAAKQFVAEGVERDKAARGALLQEVRDGAQHEFQSARASIVNAAVALQADLKVGDIPVIGLTKTIESATLSRADKQVIRTLAANELREITSSTNEAMWGIHERANLEQISQKAAQDQTLALKRQFAQEVTKLNADTAEVVRSVENTTLKQSRRLDYGDTKGTPDHKLQIHKAWKEARNSQTYDLPEYARAIAGYK